MDVFNHLRNMKTMLIDDDPWIRDSLGVLFESEACRLMALETAEEGLAEIRKDSYDLIIVDYQLPGLNGLEFFKRMPASDTGAVKMLITAYLTDELVSDAKKLRIHGVLEKPFSAEKFLASLATVLESQRPCQMPEISI